MYTQKMSGVLILFQLALVFFIYAYSPIILAQSLVSDDARNEAEYSPVHQGRLLISAEFFDSPCNLFFDSRVTLTECGAGNQYKDFNYAYIAMKSPVNVSFYSHGNLVFLKTLWFSNGNNKVSAPENIENYNNAWLRVSYE